MPPSKADLAKIHIAKKELGLTDEVYRDILRSRFGKKKDSAAKLTPGQAFSLIEHFKRLGWQPKVQAKIPGMEIPADEQSRKIKALWISLHEAGEVKDSSDKALHAFVRRHTGRDHLRWCFVDDKIKVIEILKQWLDRVLTKKVQSC